MLKMSKFFSIDREVAVEPLEAAGSHAEHEPAGGGFLDGRDDVGEGPVRERVLAVGADVGSVHAGNARNHARRLARPHRRRPRNAPSARTGNHRHSPPGAGPGPGPGAVIGGSVSGGGLNGFAAPNGGARRPDPPGALPPAARSGLDPDRLDRTETSSASSPAVDHRHRDSASAAAPPVRPERAPALPGPGPASPAIEMDCPS